MQKLNPFKASFRAMAMAGALCIPGLLFAGNIRQYSFQKSRDGEYEELKDADQIEISEWAAQSLILPGGDIVLNSGDYDGFPSASTSVSAVRCSMNSLCQTQDGFCSATKACISTASVAVCSAAYIQTSWMASTLV